MLVPIPPEVATELLKVPNENPKFFFWSGNGQKDSITNRWSKRYIAPVFKAANLHGTGGNMTTHRLRDTFACDLLEKGVPMEEVGKLLGTYQHQDHGAPLCGLGEGTAGPTSVAGACQLEPHFVSFGDECGKNRTFNLLTDHRALKMNDFNDFRSALLVTNRRF